MGYGIPYNHLLFSDYREPLVEEAAQVLIVTLDYDSSTSSSPTVDGTTTGTAMDDVDVSDPGIRVCCFPECCDPLKPVFTERRANL